MSEATGKRIERTVVWLDAGLVPRMDGWLKADNCKNRSEFINKALRFYMGYLGTEDNTAYLSKTILTAIQGTLDDNNNRLCLITAHVKVGNQMVEQEQKQHADPEADEGRKKGELAHALRLLDGRDQQTPDGRRHHHPGGKARKGALHQIAKGFFHKEHAGRAQCCSQERDQYSEKGFHSSHRLCIAVLFVSPEPRLVPVFGMFL